MNEQTYRELRAAVDAETVSYGELIEIESAFAEIPDEQLRDRRENAMAADMLDEIAAHFGFTSHECADEAYQMAAMPGECTCSSSDA